LPEKTCEWCSGTGQISFFKGVSRFLVSTEECPECGGLGYLLAEQGAGVKSRPKADKPTDKDEGE